MFNLPHPFGVELLPEGCGINLFIMKVCDKLKLNMFKPVSVPKNRDLYARVGGRIPDLGTKGFTADYGMNKLETLASDMDFAETQMLKDSQMPLSTDTK